jgi:glycosyltransferase involved in cell wall biosynthesis
MASVVMINDCAYVGETLIKYFPKDIEIRHIKRTRSLWSKTLGIAYRVMRTKADVYHVHYLLQDCYIAGKLGKRPLIGHAHGSDLRASLNHPLWGRIVKYNLRRCDKILVSTPDILGIARQFRDDAIYLPNPVDMQIFYPRPAEKHERRRVLIASDSNWDVKGTDIAIRTLSRIKDKVDVSIIAYGKDLDKTLRLAEKLGLHLNVLPKVPHEELNRYYWNSDVVIDRFRLGSLGVVSLEAIACGRPVIAYVSSEYGEYGEFPLKDIEEEEEIAEAILHADEKLWRDEYEYLMKNHNPNIVVARLLEEYEEMLR